MTDHDFFRDMRDQMQPDAELLRRLDQAIEAADAAPGQVAAAGGGPPPPGGWTHAPRAGGPAGAPQTKPP
ncbi:MAG: hypothetical protein LBR19_06440, partial [Bifidobacteriaceae bacterium]|nr:hypothetical protein [Bifidobacteriaceae bacterium]